MIATATLSRAFLFAVAPFIWRRAEKVAAKLEGFAATEAGSALDMLKAAELTEDATLRGLFFRHAMDEARHARMFREAARALSPAVRVRASEYELIHAQRQNLFARSSLIGFVAFVHLAEKRGALQFEVLRNHFKDDSELEALFARIGKDERFHVSYSGKLLAQWRREGKAREVFTALASVRLTRAWEAWRRTGRVLGDVTGRFFLAALYLVVLPVFALAARFAEAPGTGWKRRGPLRPTLEAARRQF